MNRHKTIKNGVRMCLILSAFVMGSMQGLSCSLKGAARQLNPCGTILDCDPLTYDWLFIDQFPDYDLDPTCTIPGLCGGVEVAQ